MSGLHPSHVTRISDASTFDEICETCGAHDDVPGGWGALERPCSAPAPFVLTMIEFARDQVYRVTITRLNETRKFEIECGTSMIGVFEAVTACGEQALCDYVWDPRMRAALYKTVTAHHTGSDVVLPETLEPIDNTTARIDLDPPLSQATAEQVRQRLSELEMEDVLAAAKAQHERVGSMLKERNGLIDHLMDQGREARRQLAYQRDTSCGSRPGEWCEPKEQDVHVACLWAASDEEVEMWVREHHPKEIARIDELTKKLQEMARG